MKNILVTGGTGYIGSHTVLELLENDYNVIIVDNFSNSHPKVLDALETIANKKIKLFRTDIRNKEKLEQIFKEEAIDAVIHFAGYKAVGESVFQPLKYYNNNLTGTITLLEVMEKYSVRKLVFSSSATVYGTPEKMPLIEGEPTGATNPYTRTKLMIENILEDLSVAKDTWRLLSLRYFNPLGAHNSGDIGENPNGIPNNLAPYITQVAIGKLDKLHVFGNDYPTEDGTCIRDYVHVEDLAKGHVDALQYLETSKKGFDIFNLGSGKGYSVFEIISSFEEVIEEKIPYEITGRRAGDLPVTYADTTKAQNDLNWKAQKNIQEMCRDSWNWQKKHPNGFED
ncbi:UDP-glucose 4-epimerase GalE [Listeria ilorinensis]|uniref:UDP-glucose 4-epimerase GalE n=1 Tax=Listeria ilorinensis TaxID=2867439 RepID=UPI001EF5E679|nr:UDP-glucose 4-epimerase GalE [Listeria ilorinensis]